MNYSRVVLLDCDIHLGYNTLADLLPYLDPPTRELVVNSGTNGLAMPSYPWNHPTGWIRHDLYERSADHEATFATGSSRSPSAVRIRGQQTPTRRPPKVTDPSSWP